VYATLEALRQLRDPQVELAKRGRLVSRDRTPELASTV